MIRSTDYPGGNMLGLGAPELLIILLLGLLLAGGVAVVLVLLLRK